MKNVFGCLLILALIGLAGNGYATNETFSYPSVVIKNNSDHELVVVVAPLGDNQTTLAVVAVSPRTTADFHLGVGDYIVQVAKKSHSHDGSLGAIRSSVVRVQSESYSQIFYVY